MKTSIIAILSVLPILTGCAVHPGYHYDVEIDSAFTPDQTGLIYQALDLWETVSQGQVSFTITGITDQPCKQQEDHKFCVVSATIAQVDNQCGQPGLGGCTTYDTGHDSAVVSIATLVTAGNDSRLLEELQHEIGHAMGLRHTGPGTIMCYSSACAAATVQCADVQQFDSIRHAFEVTCQ